MKPLTGCTGILLHLKSTVILSKILLLLLTFGPHDTWAQENSINTRLELQIPKDGLRIGDTIPEELWKLPLAAINHPQGKKIITLNEFRDKKLIILDFWATWCSPCIASIDKLSSLLPRYNKDLMVIPVNSHPDAKAENMIAFMEKRRWALPSVIDSGQFLFKTVFNPGFGNSIPHTVWISRNKVIAVPQTEYITEQNIDAAIRGRQLNMVMKRFDLRPLDFNIPLFVDGNGNTGIYYRRKPHSVIARYLPDYGTVPLQYKQRSDTTLLAAVNLPIEHLFFSAYKPWLLPNLTPNTGIVWNISDELNERFFNRPAFDVKYETAKVLKRQNWLLRNSYGYNLRYPEKLTEKEALYFMQQDLQRFFGAYLQLEARVAPAMTHRYAVLRLSAPRHEAEKLLESKGAKRGTVRTATVNEYYGQHYQKGFLKRLSTAIPGLTVPDIIDSTGLNPEMRVDFKIPAAALNDPAVLSKTLREYGLALAVEEKPVPVLVIEQKTSIGSGGD